MIDPLYDWNGVHFVRRDADGMFVGGWTNEEAEAFATRVEELAVDELIAKAKATPRLRLVDDDGGAA